MLALHFMRKKLLIQHLLSLTLGGCIYLFFRSDTLLMFDWVEKLLPSKSLEAIRTYTLPINKDLPGWVIYSLPDGLWISSYVFLMFSIWGESLSAKSIIWLLLIPIAAMLSEFGQLIDIIPGTFDPLDLICYMIGFCLPALLIVKYNKSKHIQHEKNNF